MRLLCLAALVAACGRSGPATAEGSAGLATTIDSTADTVFARVRGMPADNAVRAMVEELRIAPAAEDTTLFTEVFEFDVDGAGQFWAYDRPSNTILLFNPAGKLLRRVGRQGAGPGEFNSNSGMVALGDTGLAIWDSRNARISFFSAAGDFRTSWITPAQFSTSNGLATDRSGELYLKRPVTPPREGEILGRIGLVRLKAGGVFADSLLPPDLPVPRESYVATSPDGSGRSSMSSSLSPGYFWGWHPGGYFVVADGGNYHIVLARPVGKPLAIARELAAVPAQEEERSEERARILWSMQRTDPRWSWNGPAIPAAKPPLAGLFLARDGRIWARVAALSERIPEAELPVARENSPPVGHFRTPAVYEVFDAQGRFLGRVALPRRSSLVEADGNTVWLLQRDENDLPALVRFRIEPALR